MINVGIIGCGFVGGALKKWIEENNSKNIKLLISDPPLGLNDNVNLSDIIFISIHIPTEENGTQDLLLLENIIKNTPNKPIFIRTTLLPGTSLYLKEKYKKNIYFMPEFLTERTAYHDFCNQTMIFTGECELLEKIFIGKKYIKMSSLEAEITKYAHNVFGALKVTYFNGIYNLCQSFNVNYDNIKNGILVSGYIDPNHTQVPGPDGMFGYGGKCFPKDVNAFAKLTEEFPLGELIKLISSQNEQYRNKINDK